MKMVRLSRQVGIEIECASGDSHSMARALRQSERPELANVIDAGWHSGFQPLLWKCEPDGSCAGEAISPPLGATESVEAAMACLRSSGLTVDRSCGLHTHVDSVNRDGVLMPLLGAKNLMKAWLRFNPVFFRLISKSRKQNGYCKPPSRYGTLAEDFARVDACDSVRELQSEFTHGKYSSLNLTPYVRGGTLEFRLHQGSLDGKKIRQWARLLTAFVDACQDMRHVPSNETAPSIDELLVWCRPNDLTATESGVGQGVNYTTRTVHRREPRNNGATARHEIFTIADAWVAASADRHYSELKRGLASWLATAILDGNGYPEGSGLLVTLQGQRERFAAYLDGVDDKKKRVLQVLSHWRRERARDNGVATSVDTSSQIKPFDAALTAWFTARSAALGHPTCGAVVEAGRARVAEIAAAAAIRATDEANREARRTASELATREERARSTRNAELVRPLRVAVANFGSGSLASRREAVDAARVILDRIASELSDRVCADWHDYIDVESRAISSALSSS